MDATKRPLLIPPEFSVYAEKHGIFQIYEVRRLIGFPSFASYLNGSALLDGQIKPAECPTRLANGFPFYGKTSIHSQLL